MAGQSGGEAQRAGVGTRSVAVVALVGVVAGLAVLGAPARPAAATENARLAWARPVGGSGVDVVAAVAPDGVGGVVVAGSYSGTATVGSGPGAVALTSAGGRDGFVARLDAGGTTTWARSVGGTGDDALSGVAYDASGGIAVVGTFSGSATVGSGPGSVTLTSVGGTDAVVARFDGNGTTLWAKPVASTGADTGTSASIAADGTVLAGGTFTGSVTVGAGASPPVLASVGGVEGFVARFDGTGAVTSGRRLGGAGDDRVDGVALTPAGQALAVGRFTGSATVGQGPTQASLTSSGGTDGLLARFAANGDVVHAVRLGGSGDDGVLGVASDGAGNAHLAGVVRGAATFGSGGSLQSVTADVAGDGFVARYDTTGQPAWVRTVAGPAAGDLAAVAVDSTGAVAAAGTFAATVTSGSTTLTASPGTTDLAVAAFATDGTPQWLEQAGGAGDDVGLAVAARSGQVVAAGKVGAAATFGSGSSQATVGGAGSDDGVVARYGRNTWPTVTGPSVSTGAGTPVAVNLGGSDADGDPLTYTITAPPAAGTLSGTPPSLTYTPTPGSWGSDTFSYTVTDGRGGSASATGTVQVGAVSPAPMTGGGWIQSTQGGPGNETWYGSATDAAGNTWVTGWVEHPTSFSTAEGPVSITPVGKKDVLVGRVRPDGVLAWVRSYGSPEDDYTLNAASDGRGGMLVAGWFSGTITVGSGPGAPTFTSAGGLDGYVARFDAAGSTTWARRIGGTGDDNAFGVGVAPNGDVAVTGQLSDTVDFTTGPGHTGQVTSSAYADGFVARYTAAGDLQWARGFGGAWNDDGRSIAFDAAGNLFLSGQGAALDFGAGQVTPPQFAGFIARLGPTGDLLWLHTMTASYSFINPTRITLSPAGEIAIAGQYFGDATLGDGAVVLPAGGGLDAFVARYGPDGTFRWAQRIAGAGLELQNGATIDPAGRVIAVGLFDQAVTIGSGPEAVTLTPHRADGYVAWFAADGHLLVARQLGDTAIVLPTDVHTDPAGNAYVVGTYVEGFSLADSPTTLSTTSFGHSVDAFALKLGVNRAPTATDASGTVGQYDSVDVGLTGSDPEGDPITWTVTGAPGKGTATITGSTLRYTSTGAAGADSLTVTASDGHGGTATATVSLTINAQNLQWARGLDVVGPYLGAAELTDVASDAAGNAYVTGYAYAPSSFNDAAGARPLTSGGQLDAFVAKIDPSGNLVWVFATGGANDERGAKIAVDPAGTKVVVLGSYTGATVIGSGPQAVSLPAGGVSDAFLATFSAADGSIQWGTRVSSGLAVVPFDVIVDGAGRITAHVSFSATANLGVGADQQTLGAGATSNLAVLRYDLAGTRQWVRVVSGNNATGGAIAVAPDGKVRLAGSFVGSLDAGNSITLSAAGYWGTGYVVDLGADGVATGARRFGGSALNYVDSAALAPDGTLVVAGHWSGTITFAGRSATMTSPSPLYGNPVFGHYVARWSPTSTETGLQTIDTGTGSVRMAMDGAGEVVVAGRYTGATVVGTSPRLVRLGAPPAGSSAYLARFAADGSLRWVRDQGGVGVADVTGLAVDGSSSPRLLFRFSFLPYDPHIATFGEGGATRTLDRQIDGTNGLVRYAANMPNRPPTVTARGVLVGRDIAQSFRFDAVDPDGDVLQVQVTSPPSRGTLTGSTATSMTFTPTAGAVGDDSFTANLVDDGGVAVPVTVPVRIVDRGAVRSDLLWASSLGLSSIGGVAVDRTGVTVVAANLQPGTTLGSGPWSRTFSDWAAVLAYDGNGGIAWGWTPCSRCTITSVAPASDGDVFVTGGAIDSELVLGTGLDVVKLPNLQGSGSGFVARFSRDGVPRWGRSFTTNGVVSPALMRVAPNGDVVVAGQVASTTYFEGSVNPLTNTDVTGSTGFVARWSGAGTLRWFGRAGEVVTGLAVDASSNVVVAARKSSAISAVVGVFSSTATASLTTPVLVGRITAAGTVSGAWGVSGLSDGGEVAPDGSGGVVLAGTSTSGRAALTRITSTGTVTWQQATGSGTSRLGPVAADGTGAFVAGGSADAGSAIGSWQMPSAGPVVVRISSAGVLQWVRGGTGAAGIARLAVNPGGDVSIAGTASSSLTLGWPPNQVSLPRTGSQVGFVGQLGRNQSNRVPTPADRDVSTAKGTPITLTLSATDPDPDPITFSIASPPAHGTATLAGAVLTYTPAPGYQGFDQLTYQVSDGQATATAVVRIEVAPAPPGLHYAEAIGPPGWSGSITASASTGADGGTIVAGTTNTGLFDGGTGVPNGPFVARVDQHGHVRWAVPMDRTTLVGVGVAADGTISVVGIANNSTIGTGPGAVSLPNNDAFLARLDASGALLSAESIGSFTPTAVAFDATGIAVTGPYEPWAGKTVGTVAGRLPAPVTAALVAHLDPQGRAQWITPITRAYSGDPTGVAVGPDGRIAVVGPGSTRIRFGTGPGAVEEGDPAGLIDSMAYLGIVGPDGTPWSVQRVGRCQTGDYCPDRPARVAVGADGGTYVSLWASGTVTLGLEPNLLTSVGGSGAATVIARFDPDAHVQWAKRITAGAGGGVDTRALQASGSSVVALIDGSDSIGSSVDTLSWPNGDAAVVLSSAGAARDVKVIPYPLVASSLTVDPNGTFKVSGSSNSALPNGVPIGEGARVRQLTPGLFVAAWGSAPYAPPIYRSVPAGRNLALAPQVYDSDGDPVTITVGPTAPSFGTATVSGSTVGYVAGPTPGIDLFELTLTDSGGRSTRVRVTVRVNGSPAPGTDLRWLQSIGVSANDSGPTIKAVATDGDGGVVAAGCVTTDQVLRGTDENRAGITPGPFLARYDLFGRLDAAVAGQSTGGTACIEDVTTDAAGGIVAVGSFSGTLAFGAGPTATTVTSAGGTDAFVLRVAADGSVRWLRSSGTPGPDAATGVAVSPTNVIAVVGSTGRPVAVGGIPVNGTLVRLDDSGTTLETVAVPGQGLSVAAAGEDVVVGTSTSRSAPFAPGPGSATLTALDGRTTFGAVARYGPVGGGVQWARTIEDLGGASVASVAVDSAGTIYAGGRSRAGVRFGVGGPSLATRGSSDGYVAAWTSSGTPVWARGIGGWGDDVVSRLAAVPGGGVAVTGSFTGTPDAALRIDRGAAEAQWLFPAPPPVLGYPPTVTTSFAATFDPTGTLGWSRSFGSPTSSSGGTDVAVDPAGNVGLVGWGNGSILGRTYGPVFVASLGAAQPDAAPVAPATVTLAGTAGQALTIPVTVSDPDGDRVVPVLDRNPPSHGYAVVSGTTVVYTPTSPGVDAFTITFHDGRGGLVTTEVTVTAAIPATGAPPPGAQLSFVGPTVTSAGADQTGRIAVAGVAQPGTMVGTGIAMRPATSTGTPPAVVSVQAPSGLTAWAQTINAASTTAVTVGGVGFDAAGDVVVVGTATGSLQVGSTADFITSPVSQADVAGVFVAVFDPAGHPLRVTRATGAQATATVGGAWVGADGRVVVAGSLRGAITFPAGPGAQTLRSRSSADGFVATFDAAGATSWVQRIDAGRSGSLGSIAVNGLGVDGAGHIAIAATTTGPLVFDPTGAAASLDVAGPVVASFGADGSYRWSRSVGGTTSTLLRSLAVDPAGTVYATGTAPASFVVSGAGPPVTVAGGWYLLALGGDGSLQWSRQLATSSNLATSGLVVLPGGGLAAVVSLGGSTTIGSSPGPTFWAGFGRHVVRIDATGVPTAVNLGVVNLGGTLNLVPVVTPDSRVWLAGNASQITQAPDPGGPLMSPGAFVIGPSTGNRAPTLSSPAIVTGSGSIVNGTLTISDPDGDVPRIEVLSAPRFGALTLDSPIAPVDPRLGFSGSARFTYRPDSWYAGPDQMTVRATDAAGASATVTIPIDVRPVPMAWSQTGVVWGRPLAATVPGAAAAAGVDPTGATLVVGRFTGTLVVPGGGTPSTPDITLTSAGGADGYVARYRPDGGLLWARSLGGPGDDAALGVAADGLGGLHVVGSFTGTLVAGTAPDTVSLTSAGGADGFVVDLDLLGRVTGGRRLGGAGDDRATGVAVGPAGVVLVAGQISGAATVGSGGSALAVGGAGRAGLLARFDALGAPQWATLLDGAGDDELTAVAVDPSGAAVAAGTFTGTATVGEGPSALTRSAAGGTDGLVAGVAADGTPSWASVIGGTGADVASAIARTPAGGVAVGGSFTGTASIAGSPVAAVSSAGGVDGFVAVLDSAGVGQVLGRAGGPADDRIDAVTVDGSGRITIGGRIAGAATFSVGATSRTATAAGGVDGFLGRLLVDGTVRWAKAVGGTGDDAVTGVAVDGLGNPTVVGTSGAPLTVTDAPGTVTLTAPGSADGFVLRYGVNSAPVVSAIATVTTTRSDPVTVPVPATDPDGDPLSVSVSTAPTRGSVRLVGSALEYVPAPELLGADQLAVKVNDGLVSSGAQVVPLAVVDRPTPSAGLRSAVRVSGAGDERSVASVLDPSGALYLAGYATAPVAIGTGPSALTFSPSSSSDLYLARIAPDGTPQWVRRVGAGPAYVTPQLAIDTSGLTLLAYGQLLQGSTLVPAQQGVQVGRFDTAGTLGWVVTLSANTSTLTMTATGGSVYLAGFAYGGSIAGGAASVSVGYGGFIARIDATGAPAWARVLPVSGGALASAPDGSVTLAGYGYANASYGSGSGTYVLPGTASTGLYAIRYDPTGTVTGHRPIVAVSGAVALGAAATSDGSIVVAGRGYDTAWFGAGSSFPTSLGGSGTFLVRIDPSGAALPPVTAREVYSPSADVTIDPAGRVVVVARWSGSGAVVPVSPGSGLNPFAVDTASSAVTVLSPALQPIWKRVVGASAGRPSTDAAGNIALGGALVAPLTLGDSPATITLTPADATDGFAAVLGRDQLNRAPVGHSSTIRALDSLAAPITLDLVDPDGDPLTWQLVTPPTTGTLFGSPPAVSYQPPPGFAGTAAFTYAATDPSGASATSTVTVQVSRSGPPPIKGASVAGFDALDRSAVSDAGDVYLSGAAWHTVTLPDGSTLPIGGALARVGADGAWRWTKPMPGVVAVTPVSGGDVVVTGALTGPTTFATTPVTSVDPLADGTWAYVARVAPDGSFRWLRPLVSSGGVTPQTIRVTPSGQIAVAGWWNGTMGVGTGPGMLNLGTVSSSSNMFLVLLDQSGGPVALRRLAETGGTVRIAFDAAGDLVAALTLALPTVIGQGTGAVSIGGGSGVVLARFAPAGTVRWATRVTTPTSGYADNAWVPGIEVDASGNLVVLFTGLNGTTVNGSSGVPRTDSGALLAWFSPTGGLVDGRRIQATAAVGLAMAGGSVVVTADAAIGTVGVGVEGIVGVAKVLGSETVHALVTFDSTTHDATGLEPITTWGASSATALATTPSGQVTVAGAFGSSLWTGRAPRSVGLSSFGVTGYVVWFGDPSPSVADQTIRTSSDVPVTANLVARAWTPTGVLSYAVAANPAHGTVTGSGPAWTYRSSPGYAGPDTFQVAVSDGAMTSTVTVRVEVQGAPAPAGSGVSWATAVGAPSLSASSVQGVAAAGASTYAAGCTAGAASIGANPVPTPLTTASGAFVARLDASGAVQWSRRFTGVVITPCVTGLATDASGDLYVVLRGGTVTAENGPSLPAATVSGSVVLIKYGADGTVRWASRVSSGAITGQPRLAVGGGQVFVALSYTTSLTVGAAPALEPVAGSDALVVGLDGATGAVGWSLPIAGPGADQATGIAVTPTGDVAVLATIGASARLGRPEAPVGQLALAEPARSAAVLVRTTSVGALVSTTPVATTAVDAVGSPPPLVTGPLAVGSAGEATAVVTYRSAVDLPGSLGRLPVAGGADAALVRVDSTGTATWARTVAGPGDDAIDGIAPASTGRVVAAGSYRGTAAIGGTSAQLVSAGGSDGALLTVAADGSVVTARSLAGAGDGTALAVAADAGGTVLVGGTTSGDVVLGSGAPPFTLQPLVRTSVNGFAFAVGPESVNTAPTAGTITATVADGTVATLSLTGSDPDGDDLQFDVPAPGPASGIASLSGSTLTFRSTRGSGLVSFPYRVTDRRGGVALGTVAITLTARTAPLAPTAVALPGLGVRAVGGTTPVALDAAGDRYAVSLFSPDTTRDPLVTYGSGPLAASTSGSGLAVTRHRPDGAVDWLRTVRATSLTPSSVVSDAAGDVTVAIATTGPVTVGEGPTAVVLPDIPGAGPAGRAVVVSFDPSGAVRWVVPLSGLISAPVLRVEPSGAVTMYTSVAGTLLAGSGMPLAGEAPSGAGVLAVVVSGAGVVSAPVVVADGSGISPTAVGSSPSGGAALAATLSGSVVVTTSGGPVALGPTGGTDVAVLTLGSGPTPTAARAYGGTGDEVVRAVAVASDGRTYLGGTTSGPSTWATTPTPITLSTTDGFIAALDTSGAPLWARSFGAEASGAVTALAALPGGGVAVGGSFLRSLTVGGGQPVPSVGVDDGVAIVRLDPSGTATWIGTVIGVGGDAVGGLVVDPNGDLVANLALGTNAVAAVGSVSTPVPNPAPTDVLVTFFAPPVGP